MTFSLKDRVLCKLGIHGPDWTANPYFESGWRCSRTAPFERTCHVCGSVWQGREVDLQYVRTVGDWRKVR